MKKLLLTFILATFFLYPVMPSYTDYTHTVLVEVGSTSVCPYCPKASEIIHSLYENASLPFYYISLVYDKSDAAKRRGMELNDFYVPMLYVDGGYKIVAQASENFYLNAIKQAAERNVKDVDMDISAKWEGNNIDIELYIRSNLYFGHLRICILEIESRWVNSKGEKYHYALMDYALNRYVFVKGEKVIRITWNNKYSLQQNNTAVLAYICHWFPHIQKNPWDSPKPNHFITQFVDNVCMIEI